MKSFYPLFDFFVEKISDKWRENCSGGWGLNRYRGPSIVIPESFVSGKKPRGLLLELPRPIYYLKESVRRTLDSIFL